MNLTGMLDRESKPEHVASCQRNLPTRRCRNRARIENAGITRCDVSCFITGKRRKAVIHFMDVAVVIDDLHRDAASHIVDHHGVTDRHHDRAAIDAARIAYTLPNQ